MDPSSKIVSDIYNFSSLSKLERDLLIVHIQTASNDGNALKWPEHRLKYLIPLCKETNGDVLTKDEIIMLRILREEFEDIATVDVLDTCIIFWKITKDPQYETFIRRIAHDVYSPLQKTAATVLMISH